MIVPFTQDDRDVACQQNIHTRSPLQHVGFVENEIVAEHINST